MTSQVPQPLIPYLSIQCQIPRSHQGDGGDVGLINELRQDPGQIEPLSPSEWETWLQGQGEM